MGCVSNCILLCINLIVMMVGIGVISLSSYVLYTTTIYDQLTINNLTGLPMWTLIGGVLITFMCLFGVCGVIRKSTCMLRFYGGLLLVVLLIELVCGVLLLVYRDKAPEFVQDKMFKMMEQYGGEDQALTDSIDLAQHDLQCCGVNSYQDWFTILSDNRVAKGCCKDNYVDNCNEDISSLNPDQIEERLYTKGCYQTLVDDLSQEVLALGILCIVLVVVQLFCIIGSFCNANAIVRAKYNQQFT